MHSKRREKKIVTYMYILYIYIHIRIIDAFTHTLCVVLCPVKAAIAYIHMLQRSLHVVNYILMSF